MVCYFSTCSTKIKTATPSALAVSVQRGPDRMSDRDGPGYLFS